MLLTRNMTLVRHVLVIDDEPDIRDVTELALYITSGWFITTAPSGEAGILMARTAAPDCVLLDVMMPGLDGFATLRRLREDPMTCHLPVILLSAKGGVDMEQRARDAGASGLIRKPFDPLTLSDEISEMLRWGSDLPNRLRPPPAI